MNRLLLFFSFLCLMAACATEAIAQQTPANTVCNEKSGLSWDMNIEPDVSHYTLYAGNQPGNATANPPVLPLVQVPHDPQNVIIDNNGNQIVEHVLNSQLGEGDKYFTVSAHDTSGNESGHSNEIGCAYNISPNAPTLKFFFVNPAP